MSNAGSNRQPSWGHTLFAVATGAFFGGLVALAFLIALLYTPWGLDRTARRLEGMVSGQIPGRLRIGGLENLELFSPVGVISATARDLVFTGGGNVEVIRVDRARIHFEPTALLSNKLHFERIDIDGGRVAIEPGARGKTRLENAFDRPKRPGAGGGKPRPMAFDFRAMHLEEMTLEVSTSSKHFTLRNIDGIMGIFQTRWAQGVTIEFDGLSGQMQKPALFGGTTELWNIDGKVRGKRDKVVDVAFEAALAGGEMDGALAYYPNRPSKVHLTLDPEGLLLSLASFAANLKTELGGETVQINLK